MSDLNKKNINYGALNRFYQDLKSHDLSGLTTEQYVDDAIATVKPIADVQALPDANENNEKIYRLNGKETYISEIEKLKGVQPEESQINKAYIIDEGNVVYFYKGSCNVIDGVSGDEYVGGRWETTGGTIKISVELASQMHTIINNFDIDVFHYYHNTFTLTSSNTYTSTASLDIETFGRNPFPTVFIVSTTVEDDSEQIDTAYMFSSADYPDSIPDKTDGYIYKGEGLLYDSGNTEYQCYIWKLSDASEWGGQYVLSLEPASEINNTGLYPEQSSGILGVHEYIFDVNNITSVSGNTIHVNESITYRLLDSEMRVITKQYQTTIPVYNWKRVVTEDELNTLDETTFTGATLTVDGSQPSIVASGSTTIVWDDLASSIPSGKSVEVSVVLINTGNSALTPTMSGNVQMMGDGNITIQPLELGLYKAKYISSVDVWLVEAINQEVSGTVL